MFKRLKWLSVQNIWENIQELLLRFPVVAAVTVIGTASAYILVDRQQKIHTEDTLDHILTKILLMCILGIPLLTGLVLLYEKFQWKKHFYWVLQAVGVVLLGIYYFVLPENPSDFSMVQGTRLLIFNIVAYLLALSVPFYEKSHSLKFWRFVENAFARLVISAFFSLTLWIGIALSLAAIDYLFGVTIEGETYLKMWILIGGIFGTWFFLAGFPPVRDSLPDRMEQSRILKIFIQYICVPLLCIFFVILYVYLGKIVILWDWPKGGVADWILGFSSAGFLVYILAYPLLEKSEHPFLKKFFRVFFALVIPMVIILFMAIGIRVQEYGVTESRYLVALGGIWLLLSSLYFLFSKQKELKMLPYLAAGFLFFAAWGPWSMYSLSVRSQYARLQNLLNQYQLIENGKAITLKDENTIPIKDRASIHSKIQYLAEHQDFDQLRLWFPTVSTTVSPLARVNYNFSDDAMKVLGIMNYYNYEPSSLDQEFLYLHAPVVNALNIQGFDILVSNVNIFFDPGQVDVFQYPIASNTYSFRLENNTIKVIENAQEIFAAPLTPYLKDWVEKYSESERLMMQQKVGSVHENDAMKVDIENSKERMRFFFTGLSIRKNGDSWDVQSGDMSVLIDYK